MPSKNKKSVHYDPLHLKSKVDPNKREYEYKDSCKSLFVLFLIFLACAPIAYACATIYVFIFEQENINSDPATATALPPTTTTPKHSTLMTTTPKNDHLPLAASCGKRIIGYYTEWEASEVTTEQLKKLTHVIYLFLDLEKNGTVKLGEGKATSRFLDLKEKAKSVNSGLKKMIGVGGHAHSSRFAPLVSDPEKRKALINSIVSFVDEHYLDGVEIFWVWSYKPDRLNHLKFIRELRKKLNDLKIQRKRSEDYVISIIVPPSITHLGDGYSINEIIKHVDFLNVLTYDYYFDGNQVGPHSPIHGGKRGNIDETMKYLTCKTRKPNKLNMAVPFYGSYWINSSLPLNDNSDDIWKPIESAEGPYAVRWNELDRNEWKKESAKFHELSKTSYIWLPENKRFLTFENERSLREKAKYIKNHNLGGFLMWAIDQDDEENTLLDVVSSSDICSVKDKDIVEYLCV